MIELVFNGGKKSNVTGESLSIQPAQINRNGSIDTEFILVSAKSSKDGKVTRKIHDLSNLASILVNQKEKVELGAVNLAVGTPDWVNSRRDALARALKLEKDLSKDSASTTPTQATTESSDNVTGENASDSESQDTQTPTPTTTDENKTQEQPTTDQKLTASVVEIKFVNTQNDKAFEGLMWEVGEQVSTMLKSLAQGEDTKEKFISMIKSDEYKFSYWGILNEDGTDDKVDNKAVINSNITLKAHWKNNR